MYTYLGVLLGPAAGSVGLGLLIGAFGIAGMAGTWWGGTAVDRHGSERVVTAALIVLATSLALLPHVAMTTAGALAVVVAWGIAGWGFVSAQQHRVTGMGPAPLLLALNSSALHLGFATGALLGGLVVDAAGVGFLWLLPVACCGAGLVLHGILMREVRP
jgi:predicted MFS family arabinose efflux permease